jgi:hypothetical protein
MPEELPDIDDIAAPLDIPEPVNTLLWACIALGALVLLILFIWLFLRSPKAAAKFRAPYDARKSALDKLHHLKEKATTLPPAECALISTEAIKEYLFKFHDPDSPFSTTGEIITRLRENGHTNEDTLTKIATLLNNCDALKYARSETDINARLPLIESAITFIREDQAPTPQNP